MYSQKAIRKYEEARKLHQKEIFPGAERAYRQALKISPDFVEAHNNLGNLYLDAGRYDKAFHAYQKALKLLPNHPMLFNNIGNALQCQDEYEKAHAWFKKAIDQDNNYANAHANLGNAQWALGRNAKAVESYKCALKLDPNLADTYTNLGGLLTELKQLDDAVNCFNQALKINPADAKAYRGLGRARNEQGQLEQAVSAYQQAITLDPGNAEFHEELGKTFSDHGEIEKSVGAYRQAVAIDPRNTEAHRALAKNTKYTEYDDHIKAMESLLSSKGISQQDSMQLAFALGKAHEDLGNFDKSMQFVMQAAGLKRSTIDYSISESRAQFEKIRAVFTTGFLSKNADAGVHDQTPIFVLGMPRSGTSLVEQILASHPDCFGAGEINDLAIACDSATGAALQGQAPSFPDDLSQLQAGAFADMGRQYLARIRHYSPDAKFITDKRPHNFLRIGLIKTILPDAKIIHCRRDPMDNCLSIFKTYLVSGHRYSYDLSELGEYYKLYQALMAYWQDCLPGFIYDQSYEDLVKSPEQQVSRLLQHCGLAWSDDCLNFHQARRKIGTASSAQVSRPIYRNSVKLWQQYEKHLGPLRSAIFK